MFSRAFFVTVFCTGFVGVVHFADAKTQEKSLSYVLPLHKAVKKVHPAGAHVRILADPRTSGNQNLFLSKLSIPAGGIVPEHRDPTEEYLYVLSGTGTLVMNDKTYELSPGDAVYMAANAKVSFKAGSNTVEVIQVFAPGGPQEKFDTWRVEE